jgi:sulfur-carrier protein
MKVHIPSPLLSYTQKNEVDAVGGTLGEVLESLERDYPGIRFRMIDEHGSVRPHIRIFVNRTQTFDLNQRLSASDRVHIVQALSGG